MDFSWYSFIWDSYIKKPSLFVELWVEAAAYRLNGVLKSSYRLTCSRCRARKVKCDGHTPQCRICRAYGQPCHYDKPPSMSEVMHMAKRIQEWESAAAAPANDESTADRPPEAVEAPLRASKSSTIETVQGTNGLNTQTFSPTFESTSAVQEPQQNHGSDLPLPAPLDINLPSMTGEQISSWQSRAVEICSLQLGIPLDTIHHLFNTYWTWVFPAFMFVSRPHFLRDMATGGPYSSPLLSAVICLQATRFTDHQRGQDLLANVKYLLGQEIHRGPSVPLVQALLQLSARELGNGSLHQAWLYSGMAFRLATDMGIMTRASVTVFDVTDSQIRGQLAWSCYL